MVRILVEASADGYVPLSTTSETLLRLTLKLRMRKLGSVLNGSVWRVSLRASSAVLSRYDDCVPSVSMPTSR